MGVDIFKIYVKCPSLNVQEVTCKFFEMLQHLSYCFSQIHNFLIDANEKNSLASPADCQVMGWI